MLAWALSSLVPRPSSRVLLSTRRLLEIHALAKLLARLEVRNVLLRHQHLLAGLRIAPGPRRPVVEAEAAEPADLDALAFREAFGHRVEDHLDRKLGVLGDQLRKLRGQAVDQLRFGHRMIQGVAPVGIVPVLLVVHCPSSCCPAASPSKGRPGWWSPSSRPRCPPSSSASPRSRRRDPSP